MTKANMDFQEADRIVLGSGEIYLGLTKEIEDIFNLTKEEEEKLVNVGAIESGATLNISNSSEAIESDNRGVIARFSQGKDVEFSTGVMTWNLDNMAKFLTGSKVEVKGNKKIMRISDKDNANEVYIKFVHEFKDESGELVVNIFKAQFSGDLEFVFSKEGATTQDYKFSAMAVGKDSNYLEIIEENYTEESK